MLLTDWLQSYRPEELFDENGRIKAEIQELAPKGEQRMAVNPITNDRNRRLPDWQAHAIAIETPGETTAQDGLRKFARDIIKENPDNFRIFGPDEAKSNRLNHVFEVTDRQWLEPKHPDYDEWLSSVGRD